MKQGFRVVVVAETSPLKERISDLLVENELQGSIGLVEPRDFSEVVMRNGWYALYHARMFLIMCKGAFPFVLAVTSQS